jgi:hypothetical protein
LGCGPRRRNNSRRRRTKDIIYDAVNASAEIIFDATNSASAVAFAADTAALAANATSAGSCATYAATAAAKAGMAAAADAALIDQGTDMPALGWQPLWLRAPPPDRAGQHWERLERALLKENKDWAVWTDWYRARLEGRTVNLPLEVARVMIPDQVWKRGPRAVDMRSGG